MSDGVLLCLVDVFVVYLRGRNEIGAPEGRREGGGVDGWLWRRVAVFADVRGLKGGFYTDIDASTYASENCRVRESD